MNLLEQLDVLWGIDTDQGTEDSLAFELRQILSIKYTAECEDIAPKECKISH